MEKKATQTQKKSLKKEIWKKNFIPLKFLFCFVNSK